MTEEREVLIYRGENGLVVEVPVDDIEVDEDAEMIHYSYTVVEGEPLPEDVMGPLIGEYIIGLVTEYAEQVIATQPE